MKCILHIGTEKTGTTLIQDWLYLNQKALSNQSVFLSNVLGKTNNRLLPAFFQHRLDDWARHHHITSATEKNAYFNKFLEHLTEEIKDADKLHDVFVISSEHLHSRLTRSEDIQSMADFLNNNFSSVKVVCYFRNQFDMAVSLYSTALKVDSSVSLENFIKNVTPENYYYNFSSIADKWCSSFGKNSCEFRIYDRSKFAKGDIRKDFISLIDVKIDERQLDFSVECENESLSLLEAVAYQAINQSVPYWDSSQGGMNILNNQIKQAISSIETLRENKIKSSERAHIEGLFEACNTKFFEKYFGEKNAFKSEGVELETELSLPLRKVQKIVFEALEAVLPFASHPSSLKDSDAYQLREIAIKIENKNALSLEDSLVLMQLAQRARPNGPFIAQKLKKYRARLA